MKLTYLGTAAAEGWPGVFCNCGSCQAARALGGKNIRTRSQAIVDGELLLDLPCDTYLHALREGLDLSAVRWLLVTHSHTDHFYPAELVLRGGCYGLDMTSAALDIYCNEAVEAYFYRAARQELEPDIEKNLHFHRARPFEAFQAGPYRVTPLPARHMETEQALIYLIEKAGKSLLYAHDTGRLLPEVLDYLAGRQLDLISLDCTSGRRENGASDGHMGLPDAVWVRQRLLGSGAADGHTRFVLNHFSHNGGLLHKQLEEQAAVWQMVPSYDGMQVIL
ncbi:MAG: MBL fold metallo-hydrolase [Eubacteriales bacterium]|nr:MBL fold metallo-hydrolase [Eubacteriales bacterium]